MVYSPTVTLARITSPPMLTITSTATQCRVEFTPRGSIQYLCPQLASQTVHLSEHSSNVTSLRRSSRVHEAEPKIPTRLSHFLQYFPYMATPTVICYRWTYLTGHRLSRRPPPRLPEPPRTRSPAIGMRALRASFSAYVNLAKIFAPCRAV